MLVNYIIKSISWSIIGAPEQQFMAKFEIETLLGIVGGIDPLSNSMGMGAYGMGMQSWDGNAGYAMQNPGSMYMGQGFPQMSQEGYYGTQQYTAG